MSVKPRGDSFQVAFSHEGKRYRKDLKTRKEGQVWEAQMRASLLSTGKPLDTPEVDLGPTLAQLRHDVYTTRWQGQKADYVTDRNACEVVSIIGSARPVSSLRQGDVMLVVETLKAGGNCNATINRKLAAFRVMVKRAQRLEWLTRPLVIDTLKEPQHRERVLTTVEESLMMAWCAKMGEWEFGDYLRLSLDTGLRMGETLRLTRADFADGGVLVRVAKGGQARTVPASRAVTDLILRLTDGLTGAAPVFANLNANKISVRWASMRRAMGLTGDDQFVPHTMRHTFCSRLARRGVNAMIIKTLAGHATITTTQRYMHVDVVSLTEAIQGLTHGQHVVTHDLTPIGSVVGLHDAMVGKSLIN